MANHLREEKKLAVLRALVEGSSINSTSRLTGVHKITITNLLVRVGARQNYAIVLRDMYLDQGFDIEVSTAGKKHQILKLKYVLFTAVWVQKYRKDPEVIQTWRDHGFEEVKISDGFRKTWTLTLTE